MMLMRGGEKLLAQLVARKLVLRAIDAPLTALGEMADQRAGDARLENDRHPARRHLARIEPRHRAFAGAAADRLPATSRSAACSAEEKS